VNRPPEDPGLWIEGISESAADSIRKAVYAFRAEHNLADDSWFIKVFGTTDHEQIQFWIGKGPRHYREQYTINDTPEAGAKTIDIWESLLDKPPGHDSDD
jgi:hypothetical protein